MKTKEYRVYWLPSSETENISPKFSGYGIDDWNEADELPSDAKKFIDIAEEYGTVATLNGFMHCFNIEEGIGMGDYIFITNKY